MTKEEVFSLKAKTLDQALIDDAKLRWDSIAKPLDGLGDFEDMICKLCAISGSLDPEISKKAIVVACADNGIVEEGVSQTGQEVTAIVTKNLGLGLSTLCTLSKPVNAKVIPLDVGINSDEIFEGVILRKVAKGTKNFLKEAAMSEEEVTAVLSEGIEFAGKLKEEGYGLLAAGEMGIGNTTTSTAVLSALLNLDSSNITGRGAGLSDAGLIKKQEVIRKGIEKYSFDTMDSKNRTFEILRCLGGFDIAFLAGLYIGCSQVSMPVVLDGFISSTAALVAEKIVPGTRNFLLPSHKGREGGNEIALNELGLRPYINGNMALGEGTGAVMLFPIIDMVLGFYKTGTTFQEEEIVSYERFDGDSK